MRIQSLVTAVVLLLTSTLSAQQQNAGDPCKKPVDQQKVDDAIKKGCAYLLANIDDAIPPLPAQGGKPARGRAVARFNHHLPSELVLLTLVHGGAFTENDEECKILLDFVVNSEPLSTYRASLKAMALAALDKNKYVEYIAQAAQFLVDTQSADGRWTYPLKPVAGIQTGTFKPKLRASAPGSRTSAGIKLKPRQGPGGGGGDNSNTQYAALGLRAAYDAGIEIPKETVVLAKQWWENSQFPDGGWSYDSSGGGLAKTETEKKADKKPATPPSATMTGGGVSSMAIYLYLLGEARSKEDFAKNKAVAAGINWMSWHFQNAMKSGQSATSNYWVSTPPASLYLAYSVERAGVMAEFQKLGDHDWYKEGAYWLPLSQQPDGSWNQYQVNGSSIPGTCLAILFLKKATVSLIDTGKKDKNKPIDTGSGIKKVDSDQK